MNEHFNEKEQAAFKTLVSYGLDYPIAENCIMSRNEKELYTVIDFLEAYGRYINR